MHVIATRGCRVWFTIAILGFFGARAPAAEPTFADVVGTHFARWDKDGDGKLSSAEVDSLILVAHVSGDMAAAVATMHQYQHANKEPALALHFLQHPPTGKDAPDFEGSFQEYRKHLAEVPRKMFAGDAPTIGAIKQGYLGDCFVLAPIGALVQRDGKAARKLIESQPDGSFDVHFGSQKVHFGRMTDTQIALGADCGAEGMWLPVLEMASGRAINGQNSQLVKEGKRPRMIAVDAVDAGGDEGKTMALLTGHHVDYLYFKPGAGKPAADQEKEVAKVRAALKSAFAAHRLVCMGIGSFHGGKPPQGMIADHAYAILGFEAEKDVLHVWNPWGTDHTPKGQPGLVHGYATRHGRFDMPLGDLLAGANANISMETGEAVGKEDSLKQ